MSIKFDCDALILGSEETYRRLVDHIEYRASEARARSLDSGSGGPLLFVRGRGSADPQVLAISRSGLFDADLYLRTYPDVTLAGQNPLLHYIDSGDDEGRWPNAYFDPIYYRRHFAAVGRWPFTTLYHYIMQGEPSGLRPCAAFDPNRYLDNSRLGPWIKRPLAHFLWIGRYHGLSPKPQPRLVASGNVDIAPRRPLQSIRKTGLKRAINVIGPLDRVGGVGVSARGYLDGIKRAAVGPVGTLVRRREFNAQAQADTHRPLASLISDAAINLVHMGPDTLPQFLNGPGRDILAGRYNIAVWYWELPTLRPEWWELTHHFHAFWAPTPFVARALRQVTTKRIYTLPPFLNHFSAKSANPPHKAGQPRFVYCFDANSVVERKNPGALLDAFLEGFPEQGEARLIFKITHPRHDPELDRIYLAAKRHADLEIIDHVLQEKDLMQLISSAVAYVSPHRSEGLGLTVAEAMAAGVPVIATPFGGAEAFVNEATAWPLAYRRVELKEDCGPYPRGYVWAEPDQRSLVKAMRDVVAFPVLTAAKAQVARQLVLDLFCSEHLICLYREALEAAAASIGV